MQISFFLDMNYIPFNKGSCDIVYTVCRRKFLNLLVCFATNLKSNKEVCQIHLTPEKMLILHLVVAKETLTDSHVWLMPLYCNTYFVFQVERHSTCAELCLDYALGDCRSEHHHLSSDMEKFHELRKQVTEAVERIGDEQKKAKLSMTWKEVVSHHEEYLAHLIRTKHQGGYYQYIIDNLAPGEVIVIIDYKMKVELGMRVRENQREWYGKRGISLHGFFVIAQVKNFSIPALTSDSFFHIYLHCLFL